MMMESLRKGRQVVQMVEFEPGEVTNKEASSFRMR